MTELSLTVSVKSSAPCSFCAGANRRRSDSSVFATDSGEAICKRCALKALDAITRAEQAPVLISSLDEPITREQLGLILEHLGISRLGNMKLYYKLTRCVHEEFWGFIGASEFLKFMDRSDAEKRLKEVSIGAVGVEHLRRMQTFLAGLPQNKEP